MSDNVKSRYQSCEENLLSLVSDAIKPQIILCETFMMQNCRSRNVDIPADSVHLCGTCVPYACARVHNFVSLLSMLASLRHVLHTSRSAPSLCRISCPTALMQPSHNPRSQFWNFCTTARGCINGAAIASWSPSTIVQVAAGCDR